jgi:multidrug resistance efflux pump
MTDPGSKSEVGKSPTDLRLVHSSDSTALPVREKHHRIVPFIVTLVASILAGVLGWAVWQAYMGAPWTRDGTVRTYVVTMAPEVAGRIVELRGSRQ